MKEYITQLKLDDGTVIPGVHTSKWVLDIMDMSDCYDVELKVWGIRGFGELVPLEIHGTWHDPKNPLYMKVTRPDGSIAFDGYGTDH